MSVPTWKRNLSKVEFLFQTYQLEIRLTQIIYNTSSKYRKGFGDTLIADCDKALYHGRVANGIFIRDKKTYEDRRLELEKMKAAIDNIGTHTYIWLEAIRHNDGISEKENAKLYDREDEIGGYVDRIIALIEGVKKTDRKTYKEKIVKEDTAHS